MHDNRGKVARRAITAFSAKSTLIFFRKINADIFPQNQR
jgi:hypothetical protein